MATRAKKLNPTPTASAAQAAGEVHPQFDVDQAGAFLELLQPDNVFEHVFCWLRQPEATTLKGTKGAYNKQAFGTLPDLHEALAERNAQGYRIFVAVNVIPPTYDEKGNAVRKADMVTVERIRAVFGDFDDPTKPLPAFELAPSIVVETSPGKHHIYWLVDPSDPLPVDEFNDVQRAIIAKYGASGSDKSILSANRMMRLPGSLHHKGETCHLVRIVEAPGHRYGAKQLKAAFPPKKRKPRATVKWDGTLGDDVSLVLRQVDEWYGPPRDDKAYVVDCPWQHLHTSGHNATEAIYYPPSADNRGQGWFKCLHNHCAERYAMDYHRAVLAHLRGQEVPA